MSVAQQHYPFENKTEFDKTFPADFIIEGLDQTRLWFYVQHVVATILFNKPAFKNVVVNGMIMAADGQKLSKRLKNYPPIEDVFAHEGADVLRLYLLSSTQATETADYMRFNRDGMRDLQRNVVGTLWNTYKFFKMYADIDKWQPEAELKEPATKNILDKWILSRLNQTIAEATKQADSYKIARTLKPIFELIDDVSNWYVRRSRRRFWKSEDDIDKQQAYATLHYVLVRICQLMAPWAPFISDYVYRQLASGAQHLSAHLTDWPEAGKVDTKLIEQMTHTRDIITEALSQRGEAKIKVRQPLALLTTPKVDEALQEIIKEEVNVKELAEGENVSLDVNISDELQREGLMREVIRHVQQYRKELDLNVDDRIELHLETSDHQLQTALAEFADIIKTETLAKKLSTEGKGRLEAKKVRIEEADLNISLTRAGA